MLDIVSQTPRARYRGTLVIDMQITWLAVAVALAGCARARPVDGAGPAASATDLALVEAQLDIDGRPLPPRRDAPTLLVFFASW
jgi:hypothetical protein